MLLMTAAALHASGCERSAEPRVLTGESMGTTYRIRIDARRDAAAARRAVEVVLGELDAALSTWRPDSWVSRFNRNRSTAAQPVPGAVWPLLLESQALARETGGRFDITVGPLVERWGFGPSRHDGPNPGDEEIRALLERCGHRKLRLDRRTRRLAKTHPAMALDFSAIAKGYAVDRIAAALDALGHERYLIEFGGDLRASGAPPGSSGWRVAVPGRSEPMVMRSGALATSGPEHQNRGGRCHLIDPRTGRALPVAAPVTARAATGARADALATARAVEQAERAAAGREITAGRATVRAIRR